MSKVPNPNKNLVYSVQPKGHISLENLELRRIQSPQRVVKDLLSKFTCNSEYFCLLRNALNVADGKTITIHSSKPPFVIWNRECIEHDVEDRVGEPVLCIGLELISAENYLLIGCNTGKVYTSEDGNIYYVSPTVKSLFNEGYSIDQVIYDSKSSKFPYHHEL